MEIILFLIQQVLQQLHNIDITVLLILVKLGYIYVVENIF